MPNLAGVLKAEIRRLARKEIKTETAAARKAAAQYRRDIAAMKRQLRDQGRQIASLERATRKAARSAPEGAATSAARFSPKWLQAHRDKLELSAADYAALVGVSAQTIYNWEQGRSRPRPQQVETWRKVRKLGKREAWEELERMG